MKETQGSLTLSSNQITPYKSSDEIENRYYQSFLVIKYKPTSKEGEIL